MFDNFEGGYEIEGSGRKRYRACGAPEESHGREMFIGVGDRFRRKIDACRRSCYLREVGSSVAGAAAQVEDATPLREASRQCVTGNVLGPQIVINLPGNDAFAREFAHGAVTLPRSPLPTLAFTLTRHSR